MELSMMQASTFPEGVDVNLIAEKASHAAFRVIADELTAATGAETTGDIAPWEIGSLEEAFRVFVRAMALNNSAIAALNEEV